MGVWLLMQAMTANWIAKQQIPWRQHTLGLTFLLSTGAALQFSHLMHMKWTFQLSGNSSLKHLEYVTNLWHLYCVCVSYFCTRSFQVNAHPSHLSTRRCALSTKPVRYGVARSFTQTWIELFSVKYHFAHQFDSPVFSVFCCLSIWCTAAVYCVFV